MEIRVYIGVIGAGKTYKAEKECTVKISFADRLREDIWKLLNWAPNNEEDYSAFKENTFDMDAYELRYLQLNGRQLMCNYADLMKSVKPSYFTDNLICKLDEMTVDPYYSDKIIGITDCRFDYEIKALIEFSIINGIQVKFIHCNFKSKRYCDNSPHNSEVLAQKYVTFSGSEKEFDALIRKTYYNFEDLIYNKRLGLLETIKCLESPYYFATNYMNLTDNNGKFVTRLSEIEFNKIVNNE